ncbi:MAG: hypothetical protein F6K24_01010, partial [Okeania sp. SIO2D1]|nr:hypothetical protein [Okeania sp. SIO2D1]
MTIQIELKNHPVWQDLTEVIEKLDANSLVTEHLELCDYKICGYWDEEDKYSEEIILPHSLPAELVSNSIGVTNKKRWIKLKFVLNANNIATQYLGELTIIYDKNMQFLDANWQINIDSIFADK